MDRARCQSGLRIEGKRRIFGRLGDADLGVRGGQAAFRLADIGAVAHDIGRQSGRQTRRGRRQGAGGAEFGGQRAGLLAHQHGDGIALLDDDGLQLRQHRHHIGELGFRLGDFELGTQAAAIFGPRDVDQFLLRLEIALGDLQTHLGGPQGGIILADLAQQGDQHGAAIFDIGAQRSIGRFFRAPGLAPQIELPRHGEARFEEIEVVAAGQVGQRIRHMGMRDLARARDGRVIAGGGDVLLGACLKDALLGHLDVEIAVDGALHQAVELGVMEGRPPLLDLREIGLGLLALPGGRRLGLRRRVIGADRAGGQRQGQKRGGDFRRVFHLAAPGRPLPPALVGGKRKARGKAISEKMAQ